MITRKFLTEFYDSNEARCYNGLSYAHSSFSRAVTDWNREEMEKAFREFRMYAAEFEGIMQRILDEQQEAVD